MKWKCAGDTDRLLTFTILGERCTGTHFLQYAIQKNFDLEYVKGDKHFFGHSQPSSEEMETRLYFIIIREPVAWIDSLWRNHYHVPDCNLESFAGFLQNEWWSQYNFEKEDGSEIMQDRHIFDKRRYKNIFELRSIKYKYLLHHLYPTIPFVCFVTYEELCNNYQEILEQIHTEFCLTRINDLLEVYMDVPYYKGSYGELFESKSVNMSMKDRFHIYANLDNFQELQDFGYSTPDTVLVTGGSGLVGNAIKMIVDESNDDDIYLFMSSKECDLRDELSTFNFLNYVKPSTIIHLACNCGGLYKNMNQPIPMFEDNIKINLNTIHVAHEIGVQTLICCLSTCVFPDKISYPISEDSLHDGPPHPSNKGYAYSKRMMEVQCELYRSCHNRHYFCVTPTNIFGPHDNFNIDQAHVIPALIHKAYLAKLNNDNVLYVNGTGKARRQFIYSLDLARIIIELAKQQFSKEPFSHVIISPSVEYSISEIVENVANVFDVNVKYDNDKCDGQLRKHASNKILLQILNKKEDELFIGMKDALEKTIEWFRLNYDVLRK